MTGQLYIYDSKQYKWLDAGATFGLSLSDGALNALLTPPAMKTFVSNKSRLEAGTRYVVTNAYADERTVTLPCHIIAADAAAFRTRFNALVALLERGRVAIKTSLNSGVVYNLLYQSMTQFSQLDGLALFSIKFIEPNPDNRTL